MKKKRREKKLIRIKSKCHLCHLSSDVPYYHWEYRNGLLFYFFQYIFLLGLLLLLSWHVFYISRKVSMLQDIPHTHYMTSSYMLNYSMAFESIAIAILMVHIHLFIKVVFRWFVPVKHCLMMKDILVLNEIHVVGNLINHKSRPLWKGDGVITMKVWVACYKI